MGIQGLSKLLQDIVPFALKENEMKNYFGEKDNGFFQRTRKIKF